MSDRTTRLFRIYKTISEMLNQRHYDISDTDLDMDQNQFVTKFGESPNREELDRVVSSKCNNADKIAVYFSSEVKCGASIIKKCFEKMKDENIKNGIVVSEKYTSAAKKASQDPGLFKQYRLELFLDEELLVNITKHDLVPKHILLSDEEKKKLLEQYHLKEIQLPRIQLNDPVSRFYGLKRGQVVKVIRPSETAGEYVTYRYVI